MAIICVSRELAAKGEETARELAEIGGYRYIERGPVEAGLAEHSITQDTLHLYDERKPSLWAAMSENRDRYLHYLEAVIFAEAAKGNCIILGRGAGVILRGIPNVVCVRVIASRAVRIDRIKADYACDNRGAEHQIKESDHNRQGFHKYFFDADWHDPSLYDLTVNTGRIDTRAAAEIIENYRRLTVSPEKEAEGARLLRDLRLKNAVIGEIIFTRRIQIQELSVDIKGSQITLSGYSVSRAASENAKEAARTVAGVGDVINDVVVVPPIMGN
jgi:cytidylate kinase